MALNENILRLFSSPLSFVYKPQVLRCSILNPECIPIFKELPIISGRIPRDDLAARPTKEKVKVKGVCITYSVDLHTRRSTGCCGTKEAGIVNDMVG